MFVVLLSTATWLLYSKYEKFIAGYPLSGMLLYLFLFFFFSILSYFFILFFDRKERELVKFFRPTKQKLLDFITVLVLTPVLVMIPLPLFAVVLIGVYSNSMGLGGFVFTVYFLALVLLVLGAYVFACIGFDRSWGKISYIIQLLLYFCLTFISIPLLFGTTYI